MEPDKKYKCFECKQLFYGKDLIEYASPGSITFKRYCEPCLAKKKRREVFFHALSKLFRIESPGPKIYSQRKHLNEKGFTDEVILETCTYLFEVKGFNKKFESLGLVNEANAREAHNYYKKIKASEEQKAKDISEMKITYVPVKPKEPVNEKPELLNPMDFLGDDEEWN